MAIASHTLDIQTDGNSQVLNLTEPVAEALAQCPVETGIVTVFVVGSTAGITTTEFEPGLVHHDLKNAFEGIAPDEGTYVHEQTWNDDNGHSHVRAALIGPSLGVPFENRTLCLGTWQQIVLIDFDTRPRRRKIILQIMGE